jgi:hypothetical protein
MLLDDWIVILHPLELRYNLQRPLKKYTKKRQNKKI